ncbi:MAG: NmrA family NAD(P)-binding protein [Saprospiraceae bacterium]|nr:NmrA family NAD(P)-binding protein [Pyrinomonadaceae bacterium]
MHIILGGTGHVGSALAENLIEQREPVTIITRDPSKARDWQQKGAQVAVADVDDTEALRRSFERGKRLFLLNPPADPSTDTDAEERRSLASIFAAIDDSGLEKIVAESTYGAQTGNGIGDLGILYEMEESLNARDIPSSIIRAAYYMSNWDMSLATAKDEGMIHSFYPADFKLPMVAPHDLGQAAARLMTEPVEQTGTHHVEGPQQYSPSDVAAAFCSALGKDVKVNVIPRDQWAQSFKGLGFSDAAAKSYSGMTAVTLDKSYKLHESPVKGKISLEEYITELVNRNAS